MDCWTVVQQEQVSSYVLVTKWGNQGNRQMGEMGKSQQLQGALLQMGS